MKINVAKSSLRSLFASQLTFFSAPLAPLKTVKSQQLFFQLIARIGSATCRGGRPAGQQTALLQVAGESVAVERKNRRQRLALKKSLQKSQNRDSEIANIPKKNLKTLRSLGPSALGRSALEYLKSTFYCFLKSSIKGSKLEVVGSKLETQNRAEARPGPRLEIFEKLRLEARKLWARPTPTDYC